MASTEESGHERSAFDSEPAVLKPTVSQLEIQDDTDASLSAEERLATVRFSAPEQKYIHTRY